MEADLDPSEVLLPQELVDQMQGMVEDVAEMQVQKLMPNCRCNERASRF